MKKVKLILVFLLTMGSTILIAQSPENVEIGFQYTPAISKVSGVHAIYGNHQSIFTNNTGLKVNLILDRFSLNLGLLHQTQGYKMNYSGGSVHINNSRITAFQTEQTGPFKSIKITNSQILMPALIDYCYFKNNKISLNAGAGLYLGFTYQVAARFIGELSSSKTRTSSFENRNYLAFNWGTGLKIKLASQINYQLRANMTHQITDFNSAGASTSKHTYLAGIDMGINYLMFEAKN